MVQIKDATVVVIEQIMKLIYEGRSEEVSTAEAGRVLNDLEMAKSGYGAHGAR